MSDGHLDTTSEGRKLIRFERRLRHPVDAVWSALTDPAELIRWWGDADVELADGGRFTMRWLNEDDDGNRVEMDARITELRPPAVLEVSGEPHGVLRFELAADGDGTRLTFTSTLDLPDEFRTRVLAGWHDHLDALARALDGGETELRALPNAEWERIHDGYGGIRMA